MAHAIAPLLFDSRLCMYECRVVNTVVKSCKYQKKKNKAPRIAMQATQEHRRRRRYCALRSSLPLGNAIGRFGTAFLSALPVPLYFHQKMVPKMSTMKLIQAIIIHWPREMWIFLCPRSHSWQTSRKSFGSSVMTPSNSRSRHHLIMSGSLTVHKYSGRPLALASRMKRAPKTGSMRAFCSMLKDTLETVRNLRAYGMEKPMCVMGNVGRYCAQRGRYLTAQQPRTMRRFQGLRGFGATDRMVSAMRRMTLSASLSS